jgi:predicted metal-dependent hydrolase
MSDPVILILVESTRLEQAIAAQAQGFTLHWGLKIDRRPIIDQPEVVAIANLHPALIVIELSQPARWLSHVRSDPATRRIPVIAIADDAVAQQRAADGAATVILTTETFEQGLPDVLIRYARVFGASAALQSGCESPLPAEVIKGLHEFNTGEYFECHETLEQAWNVESGPVRELYRAILQVGLAYYQIERGNFAGAQKMFRRSLQWFAPMPDRCQGIDVGELRANAAAAWEQLEALGPDRIAEFDKHLLKPIQYQEAQ